MSVERIEVPADSETLAEWQAHFETQDDEGLTATELANIKGVANSTMRITLREGVKSGLYIQGKAMRTDSSGRRQPVTVFRLAKQKPPRKA